MKSFMITKQESFNGVIHDDDNKDKKLPLLQRSYSTLGTMGRKLFKKRFNKDDDNSNEVNDIDIKNEICNVENVTNFENPFTDIIKEENLHKDKIIESDSKLQLREKLPWLNEMKQVQLNRLNGIEIEKKIRLSIETLEKNKNKFDDGKQMFSLNKFKFNTLTSKNNKSDDRKINVDNILNEKEIKLTNEEDVQSILMNDDSPPVLPPKQNKRSSSDSKCNSSNEHSPITTSPSKPTSKNSMFEIEKEIFDFENIFNTLEGSIKQSFKSINDDKEQTNNFKIIKRLHQDHLMGEKPPILPRRNITMRELVNEKRSNLPQHSTAFHDSKRNFEEKTLQNLKQNNLINIAKPNIFPKKSIIIRKPTETENISNVKNIVAKEEEEHVYEEYDLQDTVSQTSEYLESITTPMEQLIAKSSNELSAPKSIKQKLSKNSAHLQQTAKASDKIDNIIRHKQENVKTEENVQFERSVSLENLMKNFNLSSGEEQRQVNALNDYIFQKQHNNISLLFDNIMELILLLQEQTFLHKTAIDKLEMQLTIECNKIVLLEAELAKMSSK